MNVITKFFNDLSPLGKKLTFAALAIVVMALFDLILINPSISHMEETDQEIKKEMVQIKSNALFLGYKDKINRESQALDIYITKEVPAQEEIIAAFLKSIEMLASKSSVNLVKVTPTPGVVENGYMKFRADLECSATLANVGKFMHLIDTSEELMKVVKFNFSAKKDSDDIKALISITKVVIGKELIPSPDAMKDQSNTKASESGKKDSSVEKSSK